MDEKFKSVLKEQDDVWLGMMISMFDPDVMKQACNFFDHVDKEGKFHFDLEKLTDYLRQCGSKYRKVFERVKKEIENEEGQHAIQGEISLVETGRKSL